MTSTPRSHKGSSESPSLERRAGIKRRSGLGRLQGLLARPLRLERRGGQLHVVLVDRRSPSPSDPAVALEMMRTELSDRLLAHDNANAAQAMRHLVFIHHALGCSGWAGVGALPLRVLRMALTQAEMLASKEASPLLAEFVDRLRACEVAAELREERASGAAHRLTRDEPLVSEVSHEEFAEMQRGWIDTVSSVLTMTLEPMVR
jgi:hypothetical protein